MTLLFVKKSIMEITTNKQYEHYLQSLEELREATPLFRQPKLERLLSQVDQLSRSPDGIQFIYDHLPALLETRPFKGTVWDEPTNLVPSLVGGTLLGGHPSSSTELVSELRLLALTEKRWTNDRFSADQAREMLEEVLVSNFQLAFGDFSEPYWDTYSDGELKKIRHLFEFIRQHIPFESLLEKLRLEIETLIAHRPIATDKLEMMLRWVDQQTHLDESSPAVVGLKKYTSALIHPTANAGPQTSPEEYQGLLEHMDRRELEYECRQLGEQMISTGLVSAFHVSMIRFLAAEEPDFIPRLLQLDAHGKAEFVKHREFLQNLITKFIVPANRQSIYGISRMLDRNLLSRQITWNAFNRLLGITIHPEAAKDLEKSNHSGLPATPLQLLVGGAINVLGHPLGVRQGNNPTCASARGISMWSRHAPGKLINLLMDAATAENIAFRFEGDLIESKTLEEGLVRRFDYKLDPISVVLVPHLDKVYNEMMKRAAVKHPGEDPHISVNPAFYGHWIQTGFTSVYNPLTGAVEGYDSFVRIFYASFHPDYNGGHHLIYPVPLGIFTTNAAGEMTGYHAVSLLRIERDPEDSWRAYFFNPNSEGRQNWGQGITPSVTGKGERFGESSLPFYQFASRVYAYHFNKIQLGDKAGTIPAEKVNRVKKLSRESWGKKYLWI